MAWKNQYNSFFGETASILCCFLCARSGVAELSMSAFSHQFRCGLPTVDGVNCIIISCAFCFGYVDVDEQRTRHKQWAKRKSCFRRKYTRETRAQWLTQCLGVCECMLTNDIKLLACTFFVYFPTRKKTTIVLHVVPFVSAASSVTTEK